MSLPPAGPDARLRGLSKTPPLNLDGCSNSSSCNSIPAAVNPLHRFQDKWPKPRVDSLSSVVKQTKPPQVSPNHSQGDLSADLQSPNQAARIVSHADRETDRPASNLKTLTYGEIWKPVVGDSVERGNASEKLGPVAVQTHHHDGAIPVPGIRPAEGPQAYHQPEVFVENEPEDLGITLPNKSSSPSYPPDERDTTERESLEDETVDLSGSDAVVPAQKAPAASSVPMNITHATQNRLYTEWRQSHMGNSYPSHGALIPEGYEKSGDVGYPWKCPVRFCGLLFATIEDLGSHFKVHKDCLLHDNCDGTFSVEGHHKQLQPGNSAIVVSKTRFGSEGKPMMKPIVPTPPAAPIPEAAPVLAEIVASLSDNARQMWRYIFPIILSTQSSPLDQGVNPGSNVIRTVLSSGDMRKLLELPQRRDICWSSRPFTIKSTEDIKSLLIQVTGDIAPVPCYGCKEDIGPFIGCIVVSSKESPSEVTACGNCIYRMDGKVCKPHAHGQTDYQPSPVLEKPPTTMGMETQKKQIPPTSNPPPIVGEDGIRPQPLKRKRGRPRKYPLPNSPAPAILQEQQQQNLPKSNEFRNSVHVYDIPQNITPVPPAAIPQNNHNSNPPAQSWTHCAAPHPGVPQYEARGSCLLPQASQAPRPPAPGPASGAVQYPNETPIYPSHNGSSYPSLTNNSFPAQQSPQFPPPIPPSYYPAGTNFSAPPATTQPQVSAPQPRQTYVSPSQTPIPPHFSTQGPASARQQAPVSAQPYPASRESLVADTGQPTMQRKLRPRPWPSNSVKQSAPLDTKSSKAFMEAVVLEAWEKAPGRVRSVTSESVDNIAFSRSYLKTSAENAVRVCEEAAFYVQTIRPGTTYNFEQCSDAVRLCSIASGKLHVMVDGEPVFLLGMHGLFKIKCGVGCVVGNETQMDVVMHITSIMAEM